MNRAASRSGARRGNRRARLESRRRRRNQRYGRFLGWTAVGALVPGTGLIAAGKRRIGTFLLVMFCLAAAMLLAAAVLVPSRRLLSYGGDRQMLMTAGAVLAAAAVIWLVIALTTHRALEPDGLPAGRRLAGALVVVLAASVVVAPLSIGARNAFTQRDLIGAISGGTSHTTPNITDTRDPWADIPQLNVLLLGSDAGEGREGARPDTLIVASIDTQTGNTTMVSLPRNLQHFPFPDESPLSEVYPAGWDGATGDLERMINATWKTLPVEHPEAFEGSDNPHADATKWAVEGALGIDIDYFAMVNLEGFQAIVDALGGVTLDVPRDIPVGNKELSGGGCTQARRYIQAGDNQHLDGADALWFARSRCGSDDYDRMARQQCVMGAIVEEVDPQTLVTKYQSLASATKQLIETDVPEDLFPALIELGLNVQQGTLESLTLDRKFFQSMNTSSANPDYDQLHAKVAELLDSSGGSGGDTSSGSDDTTHAEPSEDEQATGETRAGEAPGTNADETTNDAAGVDGSAASSSVPEDGVDEEEPAADEPVETDTVC